MSTCTSCGEYTTQRHAFGYSICNACYAEEDDLIERAERRDARRHGYSYGWSEDKKTPPTPQARPLSEL